MRRFLLFCDSYWSLKENNARWLYVSDQDEDGKSDYEKQRSDADCTSSDDENEEDSCSSLFLDQEQEKVFAQKKSGKQKPLVLPTATSPNSKAHFNVNESLLNISKSSFNAGLEQRYFYFTIKALQKLL